MNVNVSTFILTFCKQKCSCRIGDITKTISHGTCHVGQVCWGIDITNDLPLAIGQVLYINEEPCIYRIYQY